MAWSPERLEKIFTDVMAGATEYKCDTHAEATNLRQALNRYRAKIRKLSTKWFPPGDPRYGVCIYDLIFISLSNKPGDTTLVFKCHADIDESRLVWPAAKPPHPEDTEHE